MGAGLAAETVGIRLFQDEDIFDDRHRAGGKRQFVVVETPEELDLLVGGDRQAAVKPERVDIAGDVRVAVTGSIDVALHLLRTDSPGQFLVVPHDGIPDRRPQCVVPVPGCDFVWCAVPFDDVVLVRDDAGFQADQRIQDFEGRSRQESFRAALRVIANVPVMVEVVENEGAIETLKILAQVVVNIRSRCGGYRGGCCRVIGSRWP